MNNDIKTIIDFIQSEKNFRYISEIDCNYGHMGATIVDSVLQAGINYATVVKPRVDKVLNQFSNHQTTSSFLEICNEVDIKSMISWKDDRKPNLIIKLLVFFKNENVETCEDLSSWLDSQENRKRLDQIKGIGPKTIDYLCILVGKKTVAVDVHVRRFVQLVGIDISDYEEIKTLLISTANELGINPAVLDHSIWIYMSNKTKVNKNKSKRVFIIIDHPWEGSFNFAILDMARNTLNEHGHSVDVLDLNREDFNPVIQPEELALYAQGKFLDPKVGQYQKRLAASDHLIFIFPVWWHTMPAMLKGWLDKVLLPGFAFTTGQIPEPLLGHIAGATVLTTAGSPDVIYQADDHNDLALSFCKGTLKFCGIKPVTWMNFGDTGFVSREAHEKWLQEVQNYLTISFNKGE